MCIRDSIRSLLASEDYEEARTACHSWLERDSLSATGYKYLGQAYEGLQDVASAFLSYNCLLYTSSASVV